MVLCLKNGELLGSQQVSIDDRAFQYGDGCFTTAYIRQNQIKLWSRHLQRLQRDCAQLMLFPHWEYIEQVVKTLYRANNDNDLTGTVKIMVTRGSGLRGYGFFSHQVADVYILFYENQQQCLDYREIESDVLQLQIAADMMPTLVGVKSLNRLEQVLLKHEADKKKLVEAVVLDTRQSIVEGVSSNCFFYMGGRWLTPKLNSNGVRGIMRDEILYRMKQCSIAVEEVESNQGILSNITSLFFCNALHPMQAVHTFSGRSLDHRRVKALFTQLKLDAI